MFSHLKPIYNTHATTESQLALVESDNFDDITYLRNYKSIVPKYIANGAPSDDTLREYFIAIDHYLAWCQDMNRNPLGFTDYQIRVYLESLRQKKLSESYISQKLAAIKILYNCACKLRLIESNPADDIRTQKTSKSDELYHYFNTKQINMVMKTLRDNATSELQLRRNEVILYLMAVEGLRNVEIHRANFEDINWNNNVIMIRGKGKSGRMDPIYPCSETMKALDRYCSLARTIEIRKDNALTPLILSLSNNHTAARISRDGLRWIMNQILLSAGLKSKGISCHVFRHSCGTLLYAKTKDLRTVQETMRHKDPSITARYAHLEDRLKNRATTGIISFDNE